MIFSKKGLQLGLALALGFIVLLLPRPEGSMFDITGDPDKMIFQKVNTNYTEINDGVENDTAYRIKVTDPKGMYAGGEKLKGVANELNIKDAQIIYVDGLSMKSKRFLAALVVLVVLFLLEPVPLEITAICIGVFLVVLGITDAKEAWAPYMNPVVVFIMCCLIFAISLEKAGLTKRMGYFIIRKAGTSITKFTFILAISLGYASAIMHDAAACAVGIVTMLPLMRAAGIEPNSKTAKFMMLSLPFAASCGGMGTLMGGGRCMVSAAFLKEFTGIEITFLDWLIYNMPLSLILVPLSVCIIYFVYRPDSHIKLPEFDEEIGPMSSLEKKTLAIIGITLMLWLTKEIHGMHYSITGMLGVSALVLTGVLNWDDINEHLEWGTALFIFGGGISLGLAMGYSGAANYFAHLFFPYVKGGGWLLLFGGVAVFSAIVTNAMANVAAAALILPIVIPMAKLEGVDPRVLAMCLGTATSFAMLLVIGCPPNAIAYSYRYFKSSDLTKAGLVATPILVGVLILCVSIWWKILGLL